MADLNSLTMVLFGYRVRVRLALPAFGIYAHDFRLLESLPVRHSARLLLEIVEAGSRS